MASSLCIICNNVATVECPWTCGYQYCSEACHDEAKEFHEPLCMKMQKFTAESPRPLSHVRAILFHKMAEFVWQMAVNCRVNGPNLPINSNIPLEVTQSEDIAIDLGYTPFRTLPDNTSIRVRFTSDESVDLEINECLAQNFSGAYWKGPVLAYGLQTLENGQTWMIDLNISAIRVIDSFLEHIFDEKPCYEPEEGIEMVQAVKVHASRDGNDPFFEIVQLPVYHPIFSLGKTPVISNLVRMPLLCRRVRGEGGENGYALNIFQDWDPNSSTLGEDDVEFDLNCGSFLAVRGDRKPLRPIDIRALYRQAYHILGDLVVKHRAEEDDDVRELYRAAYDKAATPDHFYDTWRVTLMEEWEAASLLGQFYGFEIHPFKL